ncbi:hypothetical protein L210DRAFT_3505914 [Boletus edulis BED1]|uniref:Uncharacterized protein n=1 Tax=Boletus edulis BED1 TaxID=1328754 RepID=A0AAD4GBV1_BOLED|nr:hypothetical protein L210DRAFT_3505914 [Boletus edulis BED1]
MDVLKIVESMGNPVAIVGGERDLEKEAVVVVVVECSRSLSAVVGMRVHGDVGILIGLASEDLGRQVRNGGTEDGTQHTESPNLNPVAIVGGERDLEKEAVVVVECGRLLSAVVGVRVHGDIGICHHLCDVGDQVDAGIVVWNLPGLPERSLLDTAPPSPCTNTLTLPVPTSTGVFSLNPGSAPANDISSTPPPPPPFPLVPPTNRRTITAASSHALIASLNSPTLDRTSATLVKMGSRNMCPGGSADSARINAARATGKSPRLYASVPADFTDSAMVVVNVQRETTGSKVVVLAIWVFHAERETGMGWRSLSLPLHRFLFFVFVIIEFILDDITTDRPVWSLPHTIRMVTIAHPSRSGVRSWRTIRSVGSSSSSPLLIDLDGPLFSLFPDDIGLELGLRMDWRGIGGLITKLNPVAIVGGERDLEREAVVVECGRLLSAVVGVRVHRDVGILIGLASEDLGRRVRNGGTEDGTRHTGSPNLNPVAIVGGERDLEKEAVVVVVECGRSLSAVVGVRVHGDVRMLIGEVDAGLRVRVHVLTEKLASTELAGVHGCCSGRSCVPWKVKHGPPSMENVVSD